MSGRKIPEEFEQEVHNLVGNEYTVLTPYVKSKIKLKMRHNKCGYEYMVKPNVFLSGRRCPNCYGSHKRTTDEFKKEVDIPLYKVCIEFDGKQHSQPINYFGGKEAFKSLQYRDKLKTDYCKNHRIKLIRINYNYIDKIEMVIKMLQVFEYNWSMMVTHC